MPVRVGILCGGGPAPGMNSVISAATIEAVNSGWEVVGILDGFEHLIRGSTRETRPLGITDVSRIHAQGGSVLRTSRANPTIRDDGAGDPEWRLRNSVAALAELGVGALVTIGGDDTAFSAQAVANAAGGALRVAHVPKTIDNDLPLPGGMPTFGFETARHVGVELVSNLMTDAITTQRWYLVVAMGRSAGHLALGIGKAAGATLTVIAEEFPPDEPIALDHLVDIVETAILKRIVLGRPFGVVVLAEGIGLRLREEDLATAMPEVERDEHGHVRLAELELQRVLAKLVKERFRARGRKVTVEGTNIGYELRCAPPIPFDIEYTRDLGYGAIEYLRDAGREGRDDPGAMITIRRGHMDALPFGSFSDPETGRVRIREVNVDSHSYRVAHEYMIRLKAGDLDDGAMLAGLADAAGMTPAEFRARYGYLVGAGG
ncbi:MAG: diphosphate--fructose-6-phosphate 1-phosphotransferase [Actinomycetota bacterium]